MPPLHRQPHCPIVNGAHRDHHRHVEPREPVPSWQQRRPSIRTAYKAKLTALAKTITDLAPDVLAVQEVGEAKALNDLIDRLDGT